jgi:hypothetical protein
MVVSTMIQQKSTRKHGAFGHFLSLVDCRSGKRCPPRQIHLTECVNRMVLESQLPHKIVNLLFTITNQDNKLTILWGT